MDEKKKKRTERNANVLNINQNKAQCATETRDHQRPQRHAREEGPLFICLLYISDTNWCQI